MQHLSGNQRPDLLTSLMNMSLVVHLPREIHLCRSSSNAPRLPLFLQMLQNLLRATTACTFSTGQLPKVVRSWCALFILTWKCASRHNGVHFFISRLTTWLRTRRFTVASLLFDPSEPQIIGKTRCFVTLLPFRAPASSFFSLFLFSDLLSSALLLSDSSHLPSVHIVGSLTSKLPSTIYFNIF